MGSKINVTEIISKHKSTITNSNGKLLKVDRKFFVIYPIIIGLILTLLIRIPNDNIVNIFSICLSIFIGLFLNLLVLIISFAENKLKIKDNKNRAILLEHTFYNITYTIVISLIGLGVLFLANVNFLPSECVLNLDFFNTKFNLTIKPISINHIVSLIIYFIF